MYLKETSLEPLDQQELLPEITSTLGLVSKIFGSILSSGLNHYQPKHFNLTLILTALITTSIVGSNTLNLTYSGTHNDHPLQIHTTMSPTQQSKTKITASIHTEKIQEDHITVINNDTHTLHYLKQTTHNEVDQEFFNW